MKRVLAIIIIINSLSVLSLAQTETPTEIPITPDFVRYLQDGYTITKMGELVDQERKHNIFIGELIFWGEPCVVNDEGYYIASTNAIVHYDFEMTRRYFFMMAPRMSRDDYPYRVIRGLYEKSGTFYLFLERIWLDDEGRFQAVIELYKVEKE